MKTYFYFHSLTVLLFVSFVSEQLFSTETEVVLVELFIEGEE